MKVRTAIGSKAEKLSPKQKDLVRDHLKEVLASPAFAGSRRAQDFLQLIVEHALAEEFDSLRERMIGVEMFNRPVDYDTANDSVVRVKATEVRKKLGQYYLESGDKRSTRIELPSGSYIPKFFFAPQKTHLAEVRLKEEASTTIEPLSDSAHQEQAPVKEAEAIAFSSPAKRHPYLARMIFGLAIGVGIIAALLGYWGFKRWYSNRGGPAQIRSIAILPFENLSGDPKQDYFADGMTEELISDLGQVSSLYVISRTSSMSYKGSKKELPQIARELGVRGVVEGAVLREGNQVRITVRLVDAKTDHPLWSQTYIRDLTNILALQGELAQAIANELSTNVTPEIQSRLARTRPVNSDAEDLYLQGMTRLNANDVNKAMEYFQQAIATDPNFAQAHAMLAGCYGSLGEAGRLSYTDAFFRQKTEAKRAIELDESLPEGHAELANAAMNLDWDWNTAKKEFLRALDLNPSSAVVRRRYSVYLRRVGKPAEAVDEAKRGLVLDPLSPRSLSSLAYAYYDARQYDQALSVAQGPEMRELGIPYDSFLLGDIYAGKEMYTKSIAEFLKLDDRPHALGHLGNAYGRAGQSANAYRTIGALKEHVRKNGVGRYEIALVYTGLGEKDLAFYWLEEAYRTHDEGLTNLKIDPCLEPLHSDSRFSDLMRRIGLPA